jgi:class 3 adenylate cyclase/predicted ATPase
MTNLLPTIAAYLPQSLTRSVLREPSPHPPTEPQTKQIEAAVLFADISGFTPLTEALSQRGSEGPEELTRLLNRYFSWMVEFVEAEGGEVVKFGGDSLTVVFSATDEPLSVATRRAMQAAYSMQTVMDDFGIMESSVGLVALKMKFGIGAGNLLATYVGGVHDRWEYMIAGDALRQATQAENRAEENEIVLSPEAQAVIAPQEALPRPLPAINWAETQNPSAVEKVLVYYVPGAVRHWLDKGLHNWLATLRPMSVMFIGIKGLDYDQPNAVPKLHTFLRHIQKIIYHYWGSLTRLTVDDKGTVLLVLFGAPPLSHEDDPERALRCALDLQASTQTDALQLAIGVTADRVFAGPVGGNTRREYTVMGDAVNLAARLMVAAGPGAINCSYEVYRRTAERINFEALPPMEVKGKAGLIPIYRPLGNQNPTQLTRQRWQEKQDPPVGRQAELELLKAALEKAQAARSRLVIIEGEAGIGKSRLVKALVNMAQEQNISMLLTIGQSIEQGTPFYAWKDFFLAHFNLDSLTVATPSEQQRHIQAQVQAVNPQLVPYIPLLNDFLDTNLPENGFTTSLADSTRREHLITLLLGLLQSLVAPEPLLFILENGHWFDAYSWRLMVQLAVAVVKDKLPLLLVLVTRPLDNIAMRTEITMLAALEETEYLRLDSLSAPETLTLAVQRMGLTHNDLPEAVSKLVNERAGGNPFFAEELFYSLHDNGYITFKSIQNKVRCLISGDFERAAQNLPVTIHSVVLARIDQLPPEKQLLLRIAAVIGHTFAYNILYDTLKQNLDIQEKLVKDYLDDLTYLGLIRPETSDLTYSFKHTIIREVAYESLLFDQRRQLHRAVAQWYEKSYGVDPTKILSFEPIEPHLTIVSSTAMRLAPYYLTLVYHWHQAEDEEHERIYATVIARHSVAQFANAEAVGYLNRVLDLTPRADLTRRYSLLMLRETVYDRYGAREAQAQDLAALSTIVTHLDNPKCKIILFLRQANYAEAIGDYTTALLAAQQAIALAEQIKDVAHQSQGYALWGNVLLQQCNYQAAQEKLEHALTLAQNSQHPLAQAYSLLYLVTLYLSQGFWAAAQEQCQQILNICHQHLLKARAYNLLGLINYHLADYATAQNHFEQANSIFYLIGERRGSYQTLHNIGLIQLKQGQLEAARDYFEYILELQREIHDLEGLSNSLKNLGFVYGKLGDYRAARSYLGQALELCEEIGRRAGEADVLSKFGFVYFQRDDFQTAQRYSNLALTIQQSIGHLEGQSFSLTTLGHALAGLQQWQEAEQIYNQALELRHQLEQPGPDIDVLAGLAYVAMAQGNLKKAKTKVDKVLAWLDVHPPAPLDNALWVYLTCYKVLQNMPAATQRARAVLTTAHNLLQHQVNSLDNPIFQESFLNHIKPHQEIMTLWAATQHDEP